MAYRVNITARAARDLADLYHAIDAESSDTALRWYRGLQEAILSLEEHPNRCPVTPEDGSFRHLLYGGKPNVYRTIFRVIETNNQVEVLHIRHGAGRKFRAPDTA